MVTEEYVPETGEHAPLTAADKRKIGAEGPVTALYGADRCAACHRQLEEDERCVAFRGDRACVRCAVKKGVCDFPQATRFGELRRRIDCSRSF